MIKDEPTEAQIHEAIHYRKDSGPYMPVMKDRLVSAYRNCQQEIKRLDDIILAINCIKQADADNYQMRRKAESERDALKRMLDELKEKK